MLSRRTSVIAVVAIVVVAATFGAFAFHRRTPKKRQAVVPVAATSRLAINAYPWANVTSIRNAATGVAVELDGPLVTPATAVNLPPATYEVTLDNPRLEKRATLTVDVAPHREAALNVEFVPAESEDALFGDLDATERALTSKLAGRASAETYLLRGCTRYTRAMLSAADESGLASAREDFHAALKLDRDVHLDTEWFSPKLIAFFEEVRRGG